MEPGNEQSPALTSGAVPDHRGAAEPAAIERFYQEHGAELFRFVFGVVRDVELANDVVQTSLAKAIESGEMAGLASPKSWIFRVAYHEAITARRRLGTRKAAQQRLADLRPALSPRPDDRLLRDETVEAIRSALLGLPEEQQRVVRQRIYDEKTFAEIARDSGVPIGTVLTRMRRALERLRRSIGSGDGR